MNVTILFTRMNIEPCIRYCELNDIAFTYEMHKHLMQRSSQSTHSRLKEVTTKYLEIPLRRSFL